MSEMRRLTDDEFAFTLDDKIKNAAILTSEPLAELSPMDIRQWLFENFTENNLAKAKAKVHNQVGWLGHDLDELDEPELSKAEAIYNEWCKLSDELFQQIFDILHKENELDKANHNLDVVGNFNKILPFMERNGYRNGGGWWVLI